jgi:hypothetical protein
MGPDQGHRAQTLGPAFTVRTDLFCTLAARQATCEQLVSSPYWIVWRC